MRPRVEPRSSPAIFEALDPFAPASRVLPLVPDDELESPPLPRDHPKWVRDSLAVSHRARRLIASLRPIALRILSFWDHRLRAVAVRGRTLSLDSSGSYRID